MYVLLSHVILLKLLSCTQNYLLSLDCDIIYESLDHILHVTQKVMISCISENHELYTINKINRERHAN